jgi:hypothetical protein
MRYTLKNAVLLGVTLVLNVVIATIIWYFGQESSARVDLSSDSTFIAVAMAVVFVGAVWVWYTLPPEGELGGRVPELLAAREQVQTLARTLRAGKV